MITYVIYNLETGEIDGDCSLCGIYGGDLATYDSLTLPLDHGKMILAGADQDDILTFDHQSRRYLHRVDWVSGRLRKG
ncbi:MAG: hypothetical protein QXI19_09470 [Candidatus Caldarchaeum sp.]